VENLQIIYSPLQYFIRYAEFAVGDESIVGTVTPILKIPRRGLTNKGIP